MLAMWGHQASKKRLSTEMRAEGLSRRKLTGNQETSRGDSKKTLALPHSFPCLILNVLARRNISLQAKGRTWDLALTQNHRHWVILGYHQAWHHCATAQKEAKSAVRSADGVGGYYHCLEGDTGIADSLEESITHLGVRWKDRRWINPVAGCPTNLWLSTMCYDWAKKKYH
jgi:hypothetical protein